MKEQITVAANREELTKVQSFIDAILEQNEFPMKAVMQIDIAIEELFINIALYAYQSMDIQESDKTAVIACEMLTEDMVEITLIDQGIAFDPLAKENPDITLKAEDRQIGGLGIYMVRKSMDEVLYERKTGQNIVKIRKGRK